MSDKSNSQKQGEKVEIEKYDLLPLIKEMIPGLHEKMRPYDVRGYEVVGSLIATWHVKLNEIKRLKRENRRLRFALQVDFKEIADDHKWRDDYV